MAASLGAVPITKPPTSCGSEALQRLAISYQRVSSGKQATEDRGGLDRQAAAFPAFCERHGLTPAPEALVDAGVSAYSGRNRRRGALAGFIAAAEEGRFPEGAVLVVEDLDRFSREAASRAQGLLLRLFDAGLALGIVRDDRIVDRLTYDSDIGARLNLLVRQDAANDYSAKLSGRIAADWKRKRERSLQGHKLPGYRPFWCDWDEAAGDYVLNDRAEVVRQMVRLSIEGQGLTRIAQTLNREGHRTPEGKGFSYAYVRNIIRDRKLIGEREWRTSDDRDAPIQVVPGYFPAVVTVEEFEACHLMIERRSRRKGSLGKGSQIRNLFQGHSYCTCGRLLTYQGRKAKPGRDAYGYLLCLGKRDGLCDRPNLKYDEELLLRALMGQKWGQFFRPSVRRDEERQLRQEITRIEAEAAKAQGVATTSQANFRALLASPRDQVTHAAVNRAAAAIEEAEAEAAAIASQLAGLRRRLAAIRSQPTGRELEQAIRHQVEEFIHAGLSDPLNRQRFNAWLLSRGVRITATDPQRNRWEFSLDDITRSDVALFRDAAGVAQEDDTLDQARHLGLPAAFIEARDRQIEEEIHQAQQPPAPEAPRTPWTLMRIEAELATVEDQLSAAQRDQRDAYAAMLAGYREQLLRLRREALRRERGSG